MGRIFNVPTLSTPIQTTGNTPSLGRIGNTESQIPATNTLPIQSQESSIASQRAGRIAAGEPVSVNQNRVEPTFLGNVVRGILKLPVRGIQNLKGTVAGISGDTAGVHDVETGNVDSQYLGKVYPIGTGVDKNGNYYSPLQGNFGKSLLDSVGAGAEGASYVVGGEGIEPVGKELVQGAFKQAIKTGAKEGLMSGLLGGFGTGLEDPDKSAVHIVKNTALGGLAGTVLGAGTAGIFGLAGKFFQTAKDSIANGLAKTSDPAVVTDTLVHAGVDPKVAEIIAPDIAKSSDPSEITNTINRQAAALKDFDPDKYVAEQTAKQEAAKSAGEPGLGTKTSRFIANAKAKLIDFTAPIEDVLYDSARNNNIKLKPEEDIHNQIDRVLRSPTLAGQFAKDNGIVDIIKNVDDPKKLEQYLIAKQGIDLNAKGIETGRDVVKDRALVSAYGPKYEPFAQAFSAYSQKLLDYTADSGLISKDLAENLKKEYPNYAPFNRIFSDEEMKTGQVQRPTSNGVSSISSQNIIQKIKGSEREVNSPIESILAKTNDAFKQGEKNKAGQLLASYKDLPGNPFQLRELEDGEHPKAGMSTISFLDNGQKKTFETTPEVAQAAKALNVQQLNILGKFFAFPTRIAKIGITGINLPFVGANIAKDQVSAFINSDHSFASSIGNPLNFLKALANALKEVENPGDIFRAVDVARNIAPPTDIGKNITSAIDHDDFYQEMVRAGGAGTSFDMARNQAENTIDKIRSGRSVASKVKYLVTNPSELLRSVEDIIGRSEEFTRIQQYRGTKKALLASGMSEKDATIGAARAARENTVDFARRGEWGSVLNSTFLYLNAGLQGTRTLFRNLSNKPVETVSKIVIGAFLPVAGATAWNLSSPDRKAAYDDIPQYEKQNNIIIIPPHPTKDANGKWNVIKIPLSQEIGNLVGVVRRGVEASAGEDPVKFKDVTDSLLGTVLPFQPNLNGAISTLVPQALKPTVEEATNKNLFTGSPIVPDSMKNLSPQYQVRDNTSASARKIGKLLDVSPLKVQSFIQETFGGVGTQAEHYVDLALAASGNSPKGEVGGQGILDAITARFSKASGGQTDQDVVDEVTKTLTNQADTAYLANKNAESKFAELEAMPPAEAAKEFAQLSNTNPLLAKNINKIKEADKEGLTYSDRLISQLQVKNGARAKYVYNKLNSLPTDKERARLYSEYIVKGIITKEVAAQISSLQEDNKNK